MRRTDMDASDLPGDNAVRDPVCGMSVDPSAGKPARARRPHLPLLLRGMPRQVRGRARQYPDRSRCGIIHRPPPSTWRSNEGGASTLRLGRSRRSSRRTPEAYLAGQAGARADAGGHHLHLPDAPGDRAGRPGLLPDLRHGARAEGRAARRRRADPELVDLRRRFRVGVALTVPLVVIAMGPMLGLRSTLARRSDRPLAGAGARHPGRALVRLAVLGARLDARSAP